METYTHSGFRFGVAWLPSLPINRIRGDGLLAEVLRCLKLGGVTIPRSLPVGRLKRTENLKNANFLSTQFKIRTQGSLHQTIKFVHFKHILQPEPKTQLFYFFTPFQ